MPLENSCEKYSGKLIFILPIIGFGWSRIAPDSFSDLSGTAIEPPAPFQVRLMEFYYFLGKIKAGAGIVEENNHPLDKKWAAFCIRDRGEDLYNLTTNPGKYNVAIGDNKPTIKIDPDNLPMPQWMQFQGTPCLSGLGYIVESPTSLEEIHKRIRNAQKPS